MGIPGAMMPGQGGPPPAPMGGMGGPEGGGGGIDQILGLLAKLNQSPKPDAEQQMLEQASTLINAAYTKVMPRSAKAAKALAEANVKINGALEALKSEGTRPLSGPPDLSGGMAGGGDGNPMAAAGPMGGM